MTSETQYVVTAKYTVNQVSKEIFRKNVETSKSGSSLAEAKSIAAPVTE